MFNGTATVKRIFRHLGGAHLELRRLLTPEVSARIASAVNEAEKGHSGQIRLAIDPAHALRDLLAGKSARQTAIETFARLGVWDTELNNGVLLYLQLADRQVEIVADRGYNSCVPQSDWQAICSGMELSFAAGKFEEALLAGLQQAGDICRRCFPGDSPRDELPDEVTVL